MFLHSCKGCSKSGLREYQGTQTYKEPHNKKTDFSARNVVQMKKQGGVYYVPATLNGVEMDFIFDTGASDITMSLIEASFLYKQGKLNDDDFTGTQLYRIADGSTIQGSTVNLRSVTIGNKTLYNVKASIVENLDAPLLLGQSALQKFGKVTIDYNKNEIIFE